jgi:carboxyl-terminal processing protease
LNLNLFSERTTQYSIRITQKFQMQENDNNKVETTPAKKEILMPLLLALALAIGLAVGFKMKNETLISFAPRHQDNKMSNEEIVGQGRIEEILRYIDAKYVDAIDNNVLVDKSINNILQELDPHSVFIPTEKAKEINEDLEGEYEGVGLETILLNDTFTIISPLLDSPAATVGLMSGDKILSVNDSNAIGKDIRWLNSVLHGERGTEVSIKILRGEGERPKSYTLTRERVAIHSVEVATMLDNQTGYIRISRFSNNTTKEFNIGLEKLYENKTMQDLVIDLRQNSGGYLDKAVDVLSQIFKDRDKLLVYTKGRTVHRNEYKTSGRARHEVGKIAVLIDEGSASASEIVAGAIQDWDRGLIVGRKSFGKGLVQEPYMLKDGSELRLTVARYFTPSGRSIQRPYKGKTKKQYQDEEDKRLKMSELGIEESEMQSDTSRFFTAGGRVVLGGGGIKPDYFVPMDGIIYNDYYQSLKQWIPDYAYIYYTQFRKDLKFKTWQEYQTNFKISDFAFNDFIKYTERKGMKKQPDELSTIKLGMCKLLKARVARLMYGEEGYYGILNDNDPVIYKALEVLKQKDPLGLRRLARK